MLEVVAGTVDKNEQPAESARRELFEEAGCIADELIHVATWCPDPEQSAATMTLFATRTRAPCTETLRSNSHEQEDLHVRLLGCADVEKELTFVSRIGNATTLIGLQWFVNRGRAVLAQT
jgi:ADP-ribose pyrophosphatase